MPGLDAAPGKAVVVIDPAGRMSEPPDGAPAALLHGLVLLLPAAALLLVRGMPVRPPFVTLLRIATVALTPLLVVDAVLDATRAHLPFELVLQLAVGWGCTWLAVKACVKATGAGDPAGDSAGDGPPAGAVRPGS